MNLLRELTLKGKLIFVVIHQPSSDIYKMFDKKNQMKNAQKQKKKKKKKKHSRKQEKHDRNKTEAQEERKKNSSIR